MTSNQTQSSNQTQLSTSRSSTSSPWTSSAVVQDDPPLTTEICGRALVDFMQNEADFTVATEASSHPSGLVSLYAQPYVYAGGGLGNMMECPLQTCLAGGTRRDSLTFASMCVPNECKASDLAAPDFDANLELASQAAVSAQLATEYIIVHQRIQAISYFLDTGWICGEWRPEWNGKLGIPYLMVVAMLILLTAWATFGKSSSPRRRIQKEQQHAATNGSTFKPSEPSHHSTYRRSHYQNGTAPSSFQEQKKDSSGTAELLEAPPPPAPPVSGKEPPSDPSKTKTFLSTMLRAWNVDANLAQLVVRRPATACLDGLRVLSMAWVILGHVLAIESSSGAGYSNPADFLPPSGFTTKLPGQLLFASRFAVDTFLLISGYLVVCVLCKQSARDARAAQEHPLFRYCRNLPRLLLGRLLRLIPLYWMTLGFWIIIAPHLGHGPFWYQWQPLLEACHDYGWTNLLFVNNFYPLDLGNTSTCFYHSWYLAVDVQLFLLAPLLVYLFERNKRTGMVCTIVLMATSCIVTLYLSFVRAWSINTFDGAAVVRFDIEGYAKPHIRAQAYLAGMLVAMVQKQQEARGVWRQQQRTTWKHRFLLYSSILMLLVVTFITVTGAYSRRPCRYEENPNVVECGSTWSKTATHLYTGCSRALWSWSIAWIVLLCLQGHGGWLAHFLSWRVWTPLSHLSFGAYLIHPIVIFVWQLGDMQKEPLRLLVFSMNYISVACVSYFAALAFSLVVEMPCANMIKNIMMRTNNKGNNGRQQDRFENGGVHPEDTKGLLPTSRTRTTTASSYGSTTNGH